MAERDDMIKCGVIKASDWPFIEIGPIDLGLAYLKAPPNPAMECGPRSSHWATVRAEHLKIEPVCVVCGSTEHLNVHHKKPYHLFPELELSQDNLLTLCETPTHNCHFIIGHCLDWKAYNPQVEDLGKLMKQCIEGRQCSRLTN